MRFVLDEDVDVRVAAVIRNAGHEAWGVSHAGITGSGDDAVSIYADEKDAAVVTHDKAFSARRRRNPIGRHVQLGCSEPDATSVVADHISEIAVAADRFDNVFIYVNRAGIELHHKWQ